jgi:hypothetical protein
LFRVWENGESPFGSGFEVETVINVRAAKAGLRVWEVPSFECRRIHGDSNLNVVRDGLRVAHRIWSESPVICARYSGAMAAPAEAVNGLLPLPAGFVDWPYTPAEHVVASGAAQSVPRQHRRQQDDHEEQAAAE